MVGVLLVLLGTAQAPPATRTPDPVLLHVRVYADRGVDRSTVHRSQEVARQLLASAGIELVWRLCEPAAICDPGARPPREVTVVLSRQALSDRAENCGRSAVGQQPGAGTVRASIPCVAGVAERLAISRGGVVHPLLKLAAYDDVIGVVVAHELGHVLGLKHAPGVMRARLDPTDIVALRLGALAFSSSQGARMRVALSEPSNEELAGRPKP